MPDVTGAYLRPETLDAALDVLASGDVTVAAGCTDLFPATERRELPGRVLDITGIQELSGISVEEGGLRLGAATSWTAILRADLPPALRALQLAAREVGAMQIQNRGTLAGNLCNASPAADGVPPLLVVDAEVELRSISGTRRLPLADFLTGPRRTARRSDELLTAIFIPQTALAGNSYFLKLGARSYLVISIAMTAARMVIEDGIVTDAALAVGACGPVATRLPEVERALVGHPLRADAITDAAVARTLSPIDDVRADAGYRSRSAAELLRRTVKALVTPSERAA
ncbi:MAG: xanthine dehydrogenase family protein subunit M [Pseudomonadota bacterium]